jgi:hypothetical protein
MAPEDRTHFLLTCPALETTRAKVLRPILMELDKIADDNAPSPMMTNQDNLLQIIIDCTKESLNLKLTDPECTRLESLTRTFCYALHTARTRLLNAEEVRNPSPQGVIPKKGLEVP